MRHLHGEDLRIYVTIAAPRIGVAPITAKRDVIYKTAAIGFIKLLSFSTLRIPLHVFCSLCLVLYVFMFRSFILSHCVLYFTAYYVFIL